jgi:putative acetyltransferase
LTEIVRATSPSDVDRARRLFEEYAASLDIDLGFQDFASELAGLPGEYAPPSGALLLAMDGDEAVGCVALRPLEPPHVAEIKRLYVVPAARHRGLGIRLAEAALSAARAAGYARVRLDTLSSMQAAQRLYESLGFHDIDAYRHNPHEARYLELELWA